jgi:hypothetical protein
MARWILLGTIGMVAVVALSVTATAKPAKTKKLKTSVEISSVAANGVEHTATATGKVSSPKAACRKNRKVIIKRESTGKTEGSGRSQADGSFSVTYPKASVSSFSLITATVVKKRLSRKKLCKGAVSDGFLG